MIAGVHFVRKRSRRGTVWYVYAWRGGPQVARSGGAAKPKLTHDAVAAIAEAQAARVTPDTTSVRSLIRLWRSNDPARPSSLEWQRLATSTKKVWGSALDRIEEKWGDAPLALFNDPRMKAKIVAWRDSRADTARTADMGVTVLRSLLKFGLLRGKVLMNVADGVPTIYRGGDRAEIIWTDQDIASFCAKAAEMGMGATADALRLATTTGLRREDLVTLTNDHVGEAAILKKAFKRSRGRRQFARVARVPQLDAVLADLQKRRRQTGITTLLVDEDGLSWSPDRLTKAVGRVRDAAGIIHIDPDTGEKRAKHLHDARGTYATMLMTTGNLTDQQIAEAMGWAPGKVSRIRHVYVDQAKVIVALGQRIRRGL